MNIEQGTPEWDLVRAALDVAVQPPLHIKTPTTVVSAYSMRKLRAKLDAVGLDWRKVKET